MSVENLNSRRAIKLQDSRQWTALDALREALRRVESGEVPADVAYIALGTADGERHDFACAGRSKLEIMGLVAQHLHYLVNGDADSGRN